MVVCMIVYVADYMIMTMITIAPGNVRRDVMPCDLIQLQIREFFCVVSVRFLDTNDDDDEPSTKPNCKNRSIISFNFFFYKASSSKHTQSHLLIVVDVVIYLF